MWSAPVSSRHSASVEYQARLRQARLQFADGAEIPPGLLSAGILQSWQRSRAAGLLPWQRRLERTRASYPLTDAEQQLARLCQPHLQRLWPLLGGAGWNLFCVNTQGVILSAHSAGPQDPLSALYPGRRIQEQDIGTTAPVCTLANREPLVLSGSQHYLAEFDDFFCTSCPLFSPTGELLGALDLTGIGQRQASRVLALLQQAAYQIQARLFDDLPNSHVLSLHTHPDTTADDPGPALLAFDDHGRLQAVTPAACELLALGEHWAQIPISSLFAAPDGERLLNLSQQRTALLTRLPDGSALYVRANHRTGFETTSAPRTASHKARSGSPHNSAHPLGRDERLHQQFAIASRAFAAGVPILLQGETGTGKEVFARHLHQQLQPQAPFVAINCAAIPESLLEAELFGYADGAFTGGRKGGAAGRLEAAHGGTLLLDEIGDMPLAFQTRLLRVLQERQIRRLGSDHSRPLDIRLISASLRPLASQVSQQLFREDLYYRLNGLTVELPALRQRQDQHDLIQQLLASSGCALDNAALERLLQHTWPGNIRELEQCLKLAVALAGAGNRIDLTHLPQQHTWDVLPAAVSTATTVPVQPLYTHTPATLETATPETATLEAVSRQLIQDTLQANGGNISATARQLGCSRTTLYKKLGLGRS